MEEPKRCISSINDLTDDLLMEILLRLPHKFVFQCKSVSKRWFALISKRDFARPYIRHYITKQHPSTLMRDFFLVSKQVLLITPPRPGVDFSLTPRVLPCFQKSQEEEEEACVVGSSMGLLLYCTTRDNQKTYYVCNPITKHWIVLPPNPSSQEQQEVRIGFICYYSCCKYRCRYKVVLLTEFLGSKSQINVETFSSATDQWTKFVVSCPQNIEINLCRSAFSYNKKLHWFMPSDNKILVYRPAHHKVHAIIDGPKEVNPSLGSQCFDVCCCGVVRIAQLRSRRTPQSSLSIWRLCKNTGNWCLEFQINLKELTWIDNSRRPKWANISALRKANVLALHPHAKGIVYLGLTKDIIVLDLRSKTLMLTFKRPYEIPLQAFIHVLPPWPTPVPEVVEKQKKKCRSRGEADGAEVEDGQVRDAEGKRAKKMPAAMME